jgi:uncharacterized membrane protein YeaQ/YmgE (transglycosylase-associated protein family)
MNGWYWWVLTGLAVTLFSQLLFPIYKGLQAIETMILAAVGSLIFGYLAMTLGQWKPTHWAVLFCAAGGALFFFWMVRLFSPRRVL